MTDPTPLAAKVPGAEDEFYVGYLPSVPSGVARVVKGAVLLGLGLVLAVGALAAALQGDPGPARWPDEQVTLEGYLTLKPYPMLVVPTSQGMHSVILTNPGKCGAGDAATCGPRDETPGLADTLAPLEGRWVAASGTRLSRGSWDALELADGPDRLRASGGQGGEAPKATASTPIRVRGTIVDPKCYLGAMKPGEGKVHRACAVRCIAGGIPAAIVVETPGGDELALLCNADRGTLAKDTEFLAHVGDEVEVEGEEFAVGDMRIIAVRRLRP